MTDKEFGNLAKQLEARGFEARKFGNEGIFISVKRNAGRSNFGPVTRSEAEKLVAGWTLAEIEQARPLW